MRGWTPLQTKEGISTVMAGFPSFSKEYLSHDKMWRITMLTDDQFILEYFQSPYPFHWERRGPIYSSFSLAAEGVQG